MITRMFLWQFSFFLFLFGSVLVPVFAQTTTPTSTIETTATTSTTTPEIVPPAAPVPVPVQTIILEKRTQERIINLAANISNRFDAVITRLDNIGNRLNTRISKMKSDGYDTGNAEESLANARTAITEARTEMSTIDTAVNAAVGSQFPKVEWQKVRTKYLTARERIRIAHTEMRATVSTLKNAGKIAPPATATSSETTPQ